MKAVPSLDGGTALFLSDNTAIPTTKSDTTIHVSAFS
jgi:hypothetical protein